MTIRKIIRPRSPAVRETSSLAARLMRVRYWCPGAAGPCRRGRPSSTIKWKGLPRSISLWFRQLRSKTAHLKERFALSNRRDVGLARANAHSVFDVEDKYFTIPDLPGLRGRSDGLDGSGGQLARDCHLNLDLGYKSNCIFGPAIELAMPSLSPVALDLGHCHSWHADRIESIADLFELKWLDDCDDELHECTPRLRLSLPRTLSGIERLRSRTMICSSDFENNPPVAVSLLYCRPLDAEIMIIEAPEFVMSCVVATSLPAITACSDRPAWQTSSNTTTLALAARSL